MPLRKFRVIQGGRSETSLPDSKFRLFRAHTVGDLTRDGLVYHDIRIEWYCLERSSHSFPPGRELIENHDALNGALRSSLERDAGRCFTEDELNALEAFLWDGYGMSLVREEVHLPLKERIPFFEEANTVIYDFLELSEGEGYSLPFKVWGYYSVRDSLSSKSLENGALFLRMGLSLLGLGSSISDIQLEKLAKRLHDEEGLVVEKRVEKQ